MKKADAQTLLTLMDELTELMTEYDRRTDRMVTNDLEVIQQVLLSRNELMGKAIYNGYGKRSGSCRA